MSIFPIFHSDYNSYCRHSPKHKYNAIEYICVEDGCKSKRQLCKKCISKDHRNHIVFRIDKACFPLSLLNRNSYSYNSGNIYEDLYDKVELIEN